MTVFDDPTVRRSAFLVLCLGSRAGLAAAAWARIEYPPLRWGLVGLAGMACLGWLRLYAFRLRLEAPEAGGGGTWWHSLRPVHAALYAAFVLIATSRQVSERRYAWVPLGVDVLLAICAWVAHGRYRSA